MTLVQLISGEWTGLYEGIIEAPSPAASLVQHSETVDRSNYWVDETVGRLRQMSLLGYLPQSNDHRRDELRALVSSRPCFVPAVCGPLGGADAGARFSSCGRSPCSSGERVPICDGTEQFPSDGRLGIAGFSSEVLWSVPGGSGDCIRVSAVVLWQVA